MAQTSTVLFALVPVLAVLFLVGPGSAADQNVTERLGTFVEGVANGEIEAQAALAVKAGLPDDLAALTALRLDLKERGASDEAEDFLQELIDLVDTPAVRLNLSLAYVDRMPGKNLMRQGLLSTRSQNMVAPLSEDPATEWEAAYITGLNNLYWPDWFGKAKLARKALEQAVALTPAPPTSGDKYALAYLALGDALALLDNPGEARAAWSQGAMLYPYRQASFAERLAFADAEQHEKVRDIRDADGFIDTGLSFMWERSQASFDVTLTGGRLFGPGPLEDQDLDPGSLKDLLLDHALTGEILPNNNGAAAPNPPGEIRQGLVVDGRLSNGVRAQESVDVGYVELMNGNFRLFLAATEDGPNKGHVNFFLDDQYNWTIFDDIGIDPGFAEGVIEFHDFTFSTGPRSLPVSWQTENNAPGAMDRAGSLVSGQTVPGRLGDRDADGFLDGTFNAVGRFPLDSIMLPGAPFAQTRVFESGIPVTAEMSLVLTLANRRVQLLHVALDPSSADLLLAEVARQDAEIATHLDRSAPWRTALSESPAATEALDRLLAQDAKTPPAALCASIQDLDTLAVIIGLFKSDRDISGVKTACAAL